MIHYTYIIYYIYIYIFHRYRYTSSRDAPHFQYDCFNVSTIRLQGDETTDLVIQADPNPEQKRGYRDTWMGRESGGGVSWVSLQKSWVNGGRFPGYLVIIYIYLLYIYIHQFKGTRNSYWMGVGEGRCFFSREEKHMSNRKLLLSRWVSFSRLVGYVIVPKG